MSDTDTKTAENASAAAPAPVVPTAAAPLPPESETPAAPEPDIAELTEVRALSQNDKDFFRANIRWLMAELDWARAGRTAEEREKLNP